MGGPEMQIFDPQGIGVAALFGFILALPVSMFMAFWMSAVRRRSAVVVGAFIGAFIGFLIILGWAGTLIYDTILPGANPASVFFGSLFFDSVLGLAGGILSDLFIARLTRREYRRPSALQEAEGHS